MIVVATAHGHSESVIKSVKEIKKFKNYTQVIAGNVVTPEGAKALIDAGADCINVGIGPGTICTTRMVAGVGMPQLSAILEVAQICKDQNIPLIADAASQIYPIDYMLETAQSADLVCFGAKYFGAPHSSGLVVGKKEYIDKVKAQSFIAYQLEGRNAMGRPMKLDRQ